MGRGYKKPKRRRGRRPKTDWKEDEINFLKRFYKCYTIHDLAKKLNRSYNEVYYMMRKLGLRKYLKRTSKLGRPPKYLPCCLYYKTHESGN